MSDTSPTSVTGTASVVSTTKQLPTMVTDGRCLRTTLKRMRDMPDDALEKIRDESIELLEHVFRAYVTEIAEGELGEDGTAKAGPSKPSNFGPTGLLYGRIQSGKTAAMITFSAIAVDNGFRVIIVLTSNFVELVKQTKRRFDDLARALVHASTEPDAWQADEDNIKKHVGERGLVIVCAKDGRHLDSVLSFLQKIGAASYPALILDDEADQASLDNNVAQRSKGKDIEPTKIHDKIRHIREELRHHVFLQVTATPFALFLQRVDSPMRPSFAHLLGPGSGYAGGEDFFTEKHIGAETDEAEPPLVFVDESESADIAGSPDTAPAGLARAIAFFLVSAAVQAIDDPHVLAVSQNFLCHTSHKKGEHEKLRGLISKFLSEFEDSLDPLQGTAQTLVHWAYEELSKTRPSLPELSDIVDDVIDRLPRRKIRVVNSEGKSGEEVMGAPNFIVGGNIVGRGLTIPNLLTTYYLRKPKISQMDTMLQHARMFGYRGSLMPYTRVFLPPSLAFRFHGLHMAEKELRRVLPTMEELEKVPVRVVGELRATRYGVLDTGSVVTIRSGQHFFPQEPEVPMPNARRKTVEKVLQATYGSEWDRNQKQDPVLVPLDRIEGLIRAFKVDGWDETAMLSIMNGLGSGGQEKAWLAYRPMKRKPRKHGRLLTGAMSGDELAEARARELATFFVFWQQLAEDVWKGDKFFYPSVVFPASMPNQVYNNSESEQEDS